MKIAIFGCLHGMLDTMYYKISEHERINQETIDLVLVCGDCQTIRHEDDLLCLAVPDRYKRLGDFHEYYSGKKTVPKLTIFVGGNHEASNYLMSLPYGGWVCKNFYYLGYAGCVRYKGLRIAGVSGIFNYHSCNKGRFEKLPLDQRTIRSVYHTRRLDTFRLQLLSKNHEEKEPIDIFLSHDWPKDIWRNGNHQQLFKFKPDFKPDAYSGKLGSALTEPLVKSLKPKRWFAAHLHCRFYAKVEHNSDLKRPKTEFLALGKVENQRYFMEVIDVEGSDQEDDDLYHDAEWLTIIRKTVDLESTSMEEAHYPSLDDCERFTPSAEDIEETIQLMSAGGGLKIANKFEMVEPIVYGRPGGVPTSLNKFCDRFYPNPSTEELISRLRLDESKRPYQCDVKRVKRET